MLFIIGEEIINSEEGNFVQFMDTLMTGYSEGSHLLYIKPKNLKRIYSKYEKYLNKKSLQALYFYEENHMIESNSILEIINHAIKIISQSSNEEITNSNNITYHHLHIDNFLTTAEIQKTTLLGENLDDADIYKIFSDYYIQKNSPNSRLSTKCRVENGGGNTTAPVFSKKIPINEELCLTILDSDRRYPSYAALGQTARRVIKSVKNVNGKLEASCKDFEKISIKKSTIYVEKRTRELENMLPYSFLQESYHCDVNKRKLIEEINNFLENNSMLTYYLDFKKGLSYFDVLDEAADWHKLACTDLVDGDQLQYHSQEHISKDKCSCKVIPGLGSKVLTNFIKYVGGKNPLELSELIDGSNEIVKSIWNDIGKIVFSWCCGRSIGPINA